MTLYAPPHFAGTDPARARALIDAHPFASLITAADDAEPIISHLPLLREGDASLIGHMARANPHWTRFATGRTVAVFHGPHAYVSPRWYEQPQTTVPTWNYAVVHVRGEMQLLDAAAARRALDALTQRLDPAFVSDAVVVDRLLRGIVAFRMVIAGIDAKFKMSQNKSAADRVGVIAGLRETGAAGDVAVATWMQTHE